MNGKYRLPPLTRKPVAWSERASLVLMKLGAWPQVGKLASVLTLLVLVTLCSGCATTSPPDQAAKNPEPPQLRQEIPTESYLSKALQLIESLHKRAMGM